MKCCLQFVYLDVVRITYHGNRRQESGLEGERGGGGVSISGSVSGVRSPEPGLPPRLLGISVLPGDGELPVLTAEGDEELVTSHFPSSLLTHVRLFFRACSPTRRHRLT